MTPDDIVPTHLYFIYNNWRRGFEKRTPFKKLHEMSFTTRHQLQMCDLEDTIDRATLLLQPYRGQIAIYEIIKNVSGFILLIVFVVVGIAVGLSTSNWLYCALIIACFIIAYMLIVYFSKIAYHKKLRQSHFLLSVFCRAENNRHYLNLGLELRPGYLGKWI